MQLKDDDLSEITREDVNSEFYNFSFGERKKLWLFFMDHTLKSRMSKQNLHNGSFETSA